MDLERLLGDIRSRIDSERLEGEMRECEEMREAEVGSVSLLDLIIGARDEIELRVGDTLIKGMPVDVGVDWVELCGEMARYLVPVWSIRSFDRGLRAGGIRPRLEMHLPAKLRRSCGVRVRVVGDGVDIGGELADVGADWVSVLRDSVSWENEDRRRYVVAMRALSYVEIPHCEYFGQTSKSVPIFLAVAS